MLGDDGIGPHGTAISQMNSPNDLRPSANEYPLTQNGRARPFAAIDLSQPGAESQVGVRAEHRVSVDIDAAEALDEQSRANPKIFGKCDHIFLATLNKTHITKRTKHAYKKFQRN